jgi:hypothetical protein
MSRSPRLVMDRPRCASNTPATRRSEGGWSHRSTPVWLSRACLISTARAPSPWKSSLRSRGRAHRPGVSNRARVISRETGPGRSQVVAEVAFPHASVEDPIGMRCRPPVEDCVIMNSLQVVAAGATGQVNCPSRNEWARDNIRPGHGRPSTGCSHGRWRLPCLSPRCSPPASKIRVGSRTRATSPSPSSTGSASSSTCADIAPWTRSAALAGS